MQIDPANVGALLLGVAGFLAVPFGIKQLSLGSRAHIAEIYWRAFDMLDTLEMRSARHFVYEMTPTQHIDEGWFRLNSDPPGLATAEVEAYKRHLSKADQVARSFDRLGLLVREGRLPINLVASFYASPALKCWNQLARYIDDDRGHRGQPGHMWEFENLVFEIIGPRLDDDGIWQGVSEHDNLGPQFQDAELSRLAMRHRDEKYAPPAKIWTITPWFIFSK